MGVSVLCPGLVKTRITEPQRNRPKQLSSPSIQPAPTAAEVAARNATLEVFTQAIAPAAVADLVFHGLRNHRFYIFTDSVYDEAIRLLHADIQQQRNPTWRGTLLDEDQSVRR